MSLSNFDDWINCEEQNEAHWDERRFAYLSMKHEGNQQIREAAIEARVSTNRFMFALVAVPSQAFQVVPVRHLRSEDAKDLSLSNLLMLRTEDGGKELGAWMPLTVQERDRGSIALRQTLLNGTLSLHHTLRTDRQDDVQELDALGIHVDEQPSAAAAGGDPTLSEKQLPQEQSKFCTKVKILQNKCKDLCSVFGKPQWRSQREPAFTALEKSLAACLSDSKWSGNEMADSLERWQKLFNHSKRVLSMNKRYEKSAKSVSKFVELFGTLVGEFNVQLQEIAGISADPSLRLIQFRVDLTMVQSGLAHCFQNAMDKGLRAVLQAQEVVNGKTSTPLSLKINVGYWLEFAVLMSMRSFLLGAEEHYTADASAVGTASELSSASDMLEPGEDVIATAHLLEEKFPEESYTTIREYMVSWRCVCQNYQEPTSQDSNELEKSMQNLELKAFSSVMEKAREHPFFSRALASAENRLLRFADDQIAHQKIARAMMYLSEARMPKLCKLAHVWHITRGLPVLDSAVVSSLKENLMLVVEAVKSLSEMAFLEAAALLQKWFQRFVWSIRVLNLAMSANFHSFISHSCQKWGTQTLEVSADAAGSAKPVEWVAVQQFLKHEQTFED